MKIGLAGYMLFRKNTWKDSTRLVLALQEDLIGSQALIELKFVKFQMVINWRCVQTLRFGEGRTQKSFVSVHTAFCDVAWYHIFSHNIVVEYSKALYASSISEHVWSKISLAAMASFSLPDICYGTA
jgi:hypothetical protein